MKDISDKEWHAIEVSEVISFNQMTVREIIAGGPRYEISRAGYSPEGEIIPLEGSPENENVARTMAINVFVFGEMFYLFNCRSIKRPVWQLGLWSNPLLWLGVAIMILLQMVYTYTPVFNKVFQSAPMSLAEWMLVLGISMIIFIVVEIDKWVRRSRESGGRVKTASGVTGTQPPTVGLSFFLISIPIHVKRP